MQVTPPSPFPHHLAPLTANGHAVVVALLDATGWPGMTLNAVVEATGLSRSTTGRSLRLAEERGWVRSRNGTWRLTPAGRSALTEDEPPALAA